MNYFLKILRTFLIVDIDGDEFNVRNKRIHKGEIL